MDVRDLSFRAKRIDGQGWAYGDVCNGEYGKVFILYDNDAIITCNKRELTSWGFIEVDPKTVGMYTGFQDIKAHRIYDGDMLWLTGNRQETREVIYKQGCFYGYNSTKHPHWIPLFEIAKEGNFKILGNIHDKKK